MPQKDTGISKDSNVSLTTNGQPLISSLADIEASTLISD